MRITNTNKAFSRELIARVVQFVRPSGIANFDVCVKDSQHAVRGRAYWNGSSYHSTRNPFVVIAVGSQRYYPRTVTPYQYGQHKGKEWWIRNVEEMLVYVMAHELRHLWQAKTKNKAGYVWGSRGRFSEVDTEAYALKMLRAWRRQEQPKAAVVTAPLTVTLPPVIVRDATGDELAALRERLKRWERKQKLCRTWIRKIERKIKYRQNKVAAKH